MVRQNRDVEGSGCVKDVEGKVVVKEEKVFDTWKTYNDNLTNEELVWDKHSLPDMGRASGPSEKISVTAVKPATAKKINNKAVSLSGFVSEILKASVRPVQSGWLTCVMQLLKMVRFRNTGVRVS